MDGRALDHALEAGRGRSLRSFYIEHKRVELGIDEFGQCLSKLAQIHRTGPHDAGGVRLVDQREQQMLESGQFMATRIGEADGPVNCILERVCERGHQLLLSHRVPRWAWPVYHVLWRLVPIGRTCSSFPKSALHGRLSS